MAVIRKTKGRKPKRMAKKKTVRINIAEVNYKNLRFLQQFVSDRGKMLPRRITNISAKSQRAIAVAVRQARMLAWLPFAGLQVMKDSPRPSPMHRGDATHHDKGERYASDSAR